MITAFTHIAAAEDHTLCGLWIPPSTAVPKPTCGARVGLIVGDYCAAAYVAGFNDCNDECMACRLEAAEQAASKEALTLAKLSRFIFQPTTQPVKTT